MRKWIDIVTENDGEWITVYHGHQDPVTRAHKWKFFTTDIRFAEEYGTVTEYQIRLGHCLDTTDRYTVEHYILPIEHPLIDAPFETWSDYSEWSGETWEMVEENMDAILARYPEQVDSILVTEQGCVNYIVCSPRNMRKVRVLDESEKLDESVTHIVPDIGTLIEIDDPTQFSDMGGLTKGKRRYVVKSYMKAAPEPKFDMDKILGDDDDPEFERWFNHVKAGARDGLADIADSSARRFNDGNRLMWCNRDEAEYLACGGRIIKVGEGKIVGRVAWSPEILASQRRSAASLVGKLLH
jgi:hypothetical protein